MIMGKRLAHIDLLKGIGIILVLLGHLPINGIMHMLIYSFHMPLFFFCSGFFSRVDQSLKICVRI